MNCDDFRVTTQTLQSEVKLDSRYSSLRHLQILVPIITEFQWCKVVLCVIPLSVYYETEVMLDSYQYTKRSTEKRINWIPSLANTHACMHAHTINTRNQIIQRLVVLCLCAIRFECVCYSHPQPLAWVAHFIKNDCMTWMRILLILLTIIVIVLNF